MLARSRITDNWGITDADRKKAKDVIVDALDDESAKARLTAVKIMVDLDAAQQSEDEFRFKVEQINSGKPSEIIGLTPVEMKREVDAIRDRLRGAIA